MSESTAGAADTTSKTGEATQATSTAISPQPFQLNDLSSAAPPLPAKEDHGLSEVELDLRIELGRTRMRLEDVLRLRPGSVVTLDSGASDPVDVFINNRLIARGEVVVMNERFCVRVTELVGS